LDEVGYQKKDEATQDKTLATILPDGDQTHTGHQQRRQQHDERYYPERCRRPGKRVKGVAYYAPPHAPA
jgi:hypothetical protein